MVNLFKQRSSVVEVDGKPIGTGGVGDVGESN